MSAAGSFVALIDDDDAIVGSEVQYGKFCRARRCEPVQNAKAAENAKTRGEVACDRRLAQPAVARTGKTGAHTSHRLQALCVHRLFRSRARSAGRVTRRTLRTTTGGP